MQAAVCLFILHAFHTHIHTHRHTLAHFWHLFDYNLRLNVVAGGWGVGGMLLQTFPEKATQRDRVSTRVRQGYGGKWMWMWN